MRIVQPRRLPRRLSIDQAVRPMSVELENPIANDLKRHAADLGRLGARGALVNRRQSQKSPRLRSVLRAFGSQSDRRSIKIIPERNSHGKPPGFATLNQLAADLGSRESPPPGLGIRCGECPNQAFIPVSDEIIERHLRGSDGASSLGVDFVTGVYPLL